MQRLGYLCIGGYMQLRASPNRGLSIQAKLNMMITYITHRDGSGVLINVE